MQSNGVYKHKNLTIRIKREYGKSKHLSDIIYSLILQEVKENNSKIA